MSDDRLDQILEHLKNLDRRDRIRTIGGTIRGFIGLVPTVLSLYALWYVYAHGTDLINLIAKSAAEQAALVTQGKVSTDFMEQIRSMLGQ